MGSVLAEGPNHEWHPMVPSILASNERRRTWKNALRRGTE